MVVALWGLLQAGTANADIVATMGRVAAAAALAGVGGLLAGFGLHAVPRLRAALEPLLSSWYAIPTIMFYPVLLVFFGVGAGAIVAVAVLLAIVAMVLATLSGLDRVPPVLLRTGLVLRMGPWARAMRIRLPAALPYVVTGVRLVVSYAFIGVIASEFILSGSGIGYAIANAYNTFDNLTMYGLMLLVVVLVTAVNSGLAVVDRRMRRG